MMRGAPFACCGCWVHAHGMSLSKNEIVKKTILVLGFNLKPHQVPPYIFGLLWPTTPRPTSSPPRCHRP